MAIIQTIHGPMDEILLTPNHHDDPVPGGVAHVTEYLLDGVSVHRSVHVDISDAKAVTLVTL